MKPSSTWEAQSSFETASLQSVQVASFILQFLGKSSHATMNEHQFLRKCAADLDAVKEDDGNIVVGGYALPKDARTQFRSAGAKYYTVGSLVFLLQNATMPQGEYTRSATQKGLMPVTFVDKKEILDYLQGASVCANIDTSAPSLTPQKLGVDKRPFTESSQPSDEPAAKRPSADGSPTAARSLSEALPAERIAQLKAQARAKAGTDSHHPPSSDRELKQIIQREKLYESRSTVLQAKTKKSFGKVLQLIKKLSEKEKSEKKAVNKPVETYERYDQPGRKEDR